MSRLERRDSDSRSRRSRFDQEPSPKRPRRESKPETEKHLTNNAPDVRKNSDSEQKKQIHLKDAGHLESPRQDSKTERAARRVSDQKGDVHIEGTKHSSSPRRNMQDSKPEAERHLTKNTSDVRKKSDHELRSTLQLQDSAHHDAPSRPEYKSEKSARKMPDQKRDVHIERMKRSFSPKRSRRDSKPETERHHTNNSLDVRKNSDLGQKNQSEVQDGVHLEAPSRQDNRTERVARKVSDQKRDAHAEGMNSEPVELSQHRSVKRSSDPAEAPRSQSYFQHDERGNAGQAGRSSRRREPDAHALRREPMEQVNRKRTNDGSLVDQKIKVQGKESDVWRHDGYFELEANPKPPAKKRSFREQKISADTEKPEMEPAKHNSYRDASHIVERRRERNSSFFHRPDQAFARERGTNRGRAWQDRIPSRRDRYYDRGSFSGRDTISSRPDHHPNNTVDKWKHDLFSEANKSPAPRNEEDHLAKIEALLAS
ncbi:unnamed protein product [Cuscuta campestris]|uniref:Btz domain-containing protein n=1 Tax=Cuscuta campestris TaxID=132261 RepID=A0A484L8M3_9ASTE|nr:unnamed protein product [Cuscuta campestris]